MTRTNLFCSSHCLHLVVASSFWSSIVFFLAEQLAAVASHSCTSPISIHKGSWLWNQNWLSYLESTEIVWGWQDEWARFQRNVNNSAAMARLLIQVSKSTCFIRFGVWNSQIKTISCLLSPSRPSVCQPASLSWWRLCLHREPPGVPKKPASVSADETNHPAEPCPPTSLAAAARQRQPAAAAGTTPAWIMATAGLTSLSLDKERSRLPGKRRRV